jgi:hypothetical protein
MDKPKPRRWFRFSLRTMFVLVTVACGFLGWLGWNWQIVLERKAVFRSLVADRLIIPTWEHPSQQPSPFPRNVMGDKQVNVILLEHGCPDKTAARLRALYPEAKISLPNNRPWDGTFTNLKVIERKAQ